MTRTRSTGKFLVTAALALALAATAAGKTSSTVIGKGVIIKGSKIAYGSATAKSPTSVSAQIAATPNQNVKVQWSMTCTKGGTSDADAYNSSTTPKSGQSTVMTPATVKLDLPFVHPTSCAITIYGTMLKGGKETMTILQN